MSSSSSIASVSSEHNFNFLVCLRMCVLNMNDLNNTVAELYDVLFNCAPVGRTSDSMTVPT